jgi:hypothetical protein
MDVDFRQRTAAIGSDTTSPCEAGRWPKNLLPGYLLDAAFYHAGREFILAEASCVYFGGTRPFTNSVLHVKF